MGLGLICMSSLIAYLGRMTDYGQAVMVAIHRRRTDDPRTGDYSNISVE